MAKLVLHIGTHKTATTTIQDMFAKNAPLLGRHGLIYPKLGKASGHHGLAMDWGRLPKVYELPGGSREAMRRVAKDYAHKPGCTVFLSSEELSRGDPKGRVDFAALRDAAKAFESVNVVCVLREQWQFVQSIYLEVSKSGIPQRPPVFVEQVLAKDMIHGLWTDYNLLYDHLLNSFAATEISFLNYETCSRASGGIIGSMLRHLSVDIDPSELETVNDGRSNASPAPLASWSANVISEPKVAPAWLISAAKGAFGAQFGPQAQSCLWSREERRKLETYARVRNERLIQRVRPIQPDFDFPAIVGREEDVHREDLRADFWLRSSRWVYGSVVNGLVK